MADTSAHGTYNGPMMCPRYGSMRQLCAKYASTTCLLHAPTMCLLRNSTPSSPPMHLLCVSMLLYVSPKYLHVQAPLAIHCMCARPGGGGVIQEGTCLFRSWAPMRRGREGAWRGRACPSPPPARPSVLRRGGRTGSAASRGILGGPPTPAPRAGHPPSPAPAQGGGGNVPNGGPPPSPALPPACHNSPVPRRGQERTLTLGMEHALVPPHAGKWVTVGCTIATVCHARQWRLFVL